MDLTVGVRLDALVVESPIQPVCYPFHGILCEPLTMASVRSFSSVLYLEEGNVGAEGRSEALPTE